MKDNGREKNYRYLLGELPEAEKTALEDEYFADGEKFEQVWAAENDLIDDYARGRLTDAQRERFELYYLASPKHRERVAFARTLVSAADEPRRKPNLAASPWARLLGPRLIPVWTLTMALLILGSLWLLNERSRLRNQLAQLRDVSAADRQRADELQARVAAERERNNQLSSELGKLREDGRAATSEKPLQSAVFSFLLSSTLTRGEGSPQILNPPKGASGVSLRMKLDDGDYQTYWVTVKTVGGQEVWNRQSVNARAGKDGIEVAVIIPASRLTDGDYILTLFGLNERGEAEEVNKYFFKVSGK